MRRRVALPQDRSREVSAPAMKPIIDVAVKNNFGFGGTNGTLVFRRA